MRSLIAYALFGLAAGAPLQQQQQQLEADITPPAPKSTMGSVASMEPVTRARRAQAWNMACPVDSVQIGGPNADIYGCGLEPCNARYGQKTIRECQDKCLSNPRCKAFTWADLNGDHNHKNVRVCTLYDSNKPKGVWGPQQIMCRPRNAPKWRVLYAKGVQFTPPRYLGCFTDDNQRDLEMGPKRYGYSRDTCAAACKQYNYFALQDGGWCVCGNNYQTEAKYGRVNDAECNKGFERGGGPWRNAIFATPRDINVGKANFNERFQAQPAGILRRECPGCASTHKDVYFKRITKPAAFDAYSNMLDTWRDSSNIMNRDFAIYSSLADALAGRNAWRSCNYNDNGIGFPRDCGPGGLVGGQWNSLTRGGQQSIRYSLYETAQWQTVYAKGLFSAPSFLGCYVDDGHRDLQEGPMRYGYTPDTCARACRDYTYFALQDGGWCVCGNEYATAPQYRLRPSGECNKGFVHGGGP